MKLEDKEKLLEKETAGDKSDDTLKYKLTCEAGLPSIENKEKLWKWYTDENATDSDKMFEASMMGFWQWQQLDIMKVYVDKFFDVILDVCKKRTTHFSRDFFLYLVPIVADPAIVKKCEDLLKALPPDIKARRTNVEAEIEDQKRLIKSYELCRIAYATKK